MYFVTSYGGQERTAKASTFEEAARESWGLISGVKLLRSARSKSELNKLNGAAFLARPENQVVCRNCIQPYDPRRSTAEYRGYCTMKCQHAKAKRLGYSRSKRSLYRSEYDALKAFNAIGDMTMGQLRGARK